jgi:hypothetical protein
MKLDPRKDTHRRTIPVARPNDRAAEAWSAARAGAWALTPSALIPFGSFVPAPRAARRNNRSDRG